MLDICHTISSFTSLCSCKKSFRRRRESQDDSETRGDNKDNDANEVYELFEKLAFTCLQTIDIHAEELLGSEDFLLLSPKMVQFVIKRDTLCVSSESLIIAGLNSWCVHRCSRRGAVATLKNKVINKRRIQNRVSNSFLIPEQDPPGPEAPRALVDPDPRGVGDYPDSVWSSHLQGRLSHIDLDSNYFF